MVRHHVPVVWRAALLALALCALAAGPSSAAWETIGSSPYSLTVSDGIRFIAFQPDARHAAVFDTAPGNGVTTYLIPEDCAPDGYAFIQSVGGGQLLVQCSSPVTGVRPVLLTLVLGVWHEVPLLSSAPARADSAGFGAVGANWLERQLRSASGVRTEWVNWHTSETRPSTEFTGLVPDPDRSELWTAPCTGVTPASSPYVYEPPFAVVHSPEAGLRLQRCGRAGSLPIAPIGGAIKVVRIASGIVTWTSGAPAPRAGAHLVDCHVSLLWRQPSGGTLVHAGRTLVRTVVLTRYANPASVAALRLPPGCPSAAATEPLRVRQPGQRWKAVRPYAAAWRTSEDWGAAWARIVAGTFRPTRIVVRRGVALAIDAPTAITLRWRTDAGAWRPAHRDGRRWTVPLGAVAQPQRLRLMLRHEDGSRASVRLDVVPSGG